MIPQYIAARRIYQSDAFIVAVVDENYDEQDITYCPDRATARIEAVIKADFNRVPIAKMTERLLNI